MRASRWFAAATTPSSPRAPQGLDEIVEVDPQIEAEVVKRRFATVDLAIALAPRVLDMRIVAATRARGAGSATRMCAAM